VFAGVFSEKLSNDLLDGMHAEPVAPVDQGISSCELGHEGFVIVWLIWKVELGDTSFGDNGTVIRLRSRQS
jgi:hypothetical protein